MKRIRLYGYIERKTGHEKRARSNSMAAMKEKPDMKKTVRIARLGLFLAMALFVGMLENLFPPILSFAPGAKMGLSNVVSLIAIIILGYADGLIILILRCFLLGVFSGNISAIMYSLPAGLVSLLVEIVLFHFFSKKLSLVSISFIGAVLHNATQVFVASMITSVNLAAILPLMLVASVIAGVVVGITAYLVVKYLPKKIYCP